MIASSIVSLRYFFLAVALVLCSSHLLADSTYYRIERTGKSATCASCFSKASASGKKKILAILEVPDGILPLDPEYFQALPGLTATEVDRLIARSHVAEMVPHVEAGSGTLSVFGEQLFTLLYNGSAANIASPGKNLDDHKIYNVSLTLNAGRVQNKEDMQRLISKLKELRKYGIPYLMTHFIYDEKQTTVEIRFEMWGSDLLMSEKKITQLLDREALSLDIQPLTPEQVRARAGSIRNDQTIAQRDTASGEGTSAGTATVTVQTNDQSDLENVLIHPDFEAAEQMLLPEQMLLNPMGSKL